MKRSFRATARVHLTDPDAFIAMFLEHLETHAEVRRSEGRAHVVSVYGDVWLRREAWGFVAEAVCPSPSELAMIRSFISDHVIEFAGDVAVDWSGHGVGDVVPGNFQEVTVEKIEAVTPRMRRAVFRPDDLSALLAPDHYHVRLLFPPQGRAPHWPRQTANGRIGWPTGEDALASRVYTIRSFDERSGTFAIDFVLHHEEATGPGVAFASGMAHCPTIGLLGPGGGGAPGGRNLLLIGDETALPAIARIAETASDGTTIEAIVEIEDDAERAYLYPRPGFAVTWLTRNGRRAGDPDLVLEAFEKRMREQADDLTIWAGCEQTVAAAVRAGLARLRPGMGKAQISAYWKRET